MEIKDWSNGVSEVTLCRLMYSNISHLKTLISNNVDHAQTTTVYTGEKVRVPAAATVNTGLVESCSFKSVNWLSKSLLASSEGEKRGSNTSTEDTCNSIRKKQVLTAGPQSISLILYFNRAKYELITAFIATDIYRCYGRGGTISFLL